MTLIEQIIKDNAIFNFLISVAGNESHGNVLKLNLHETIHIIILIIKKSGSSL